MSRGDRLVLETAGGAGFGDPKARDRKAVAADVANRKVGAAVSKAAIKGRAVAVDALGNDVPWDGTTLGEMVVRGPWVTAGYYHDPMPGEGKPVSTAINHRWTKSRTRRSSSHCTSTRTKRLSSVASSRKAA